MGNQIIPQPDGRYAIYSTNTDTIIAWDATREEIADWFADRAAQRAREDAERFLATLDGPDGPRAAYAQFALAWEQALEADRQHGGDAHKYFEVGQMDTGCQDCGADIGAEHDPNCDVARCLATGMQRLACRGDHEGDCGADTWSGRWPGEEDCERLGLFTADGEPDLNRLHTVAKWDAATRQWVQR